MRLISFDSFEEEEVFLIENIRERENEWRWRRKKLTRVAIDIRLQHQREVGRIGSPPN